MNAIDKLKDGFKSFQSGQFRENRDLYRDLIENGQHPGVAVVACSDSRVDPATVLQADPGDLFVIRNVANLVPSSSVQGPHGVGAALEYAVEHLNVSHILILGHAHCGGIQALVDQPLAPTPDDTSFIPGWISTAENARARIADAMPDAPARDRYRACEQAAILESLGHLMSFPFVRARVEKGALGLHGWYVDIEAGELSLYDPDTETFRALD